MKLQTKRTSPIPEKMRVIMQGKWAIVDFETTGVNPMECEPVSVSIVRSDGLMFSSLIKCPTLIPTEASKIHGITNETLENAPSLAEIAPFLFYALDGYVFGAYNVDYDYTVMDFAMRRIGLDFASQNQFCVMRMYADYCSHIGNGSRWRKLGIAAKECGIETDTSKLHGSLYDVQTTIMIMEWLANE